MKKGPMPFLNIPVSTANIVYHVSFVALLVGAALVLLSATALVWSNSIRESDAARRLANLETTSAQANAEVLQARAEVVDANRHLAQANTAAAAAEKEAAQARESDKSVAVVVGREITAENCGLFINFVKTVSKGRVVVEAILSDPEALHFARQISAMLTSAGYDVGENFGSPTLLGQAPVGVEMKIRSMDEQPVYAGSLQKGLEFIGIDTSGSLDTTAGESVVIFVGAKR
jgi:hypothetical protein